MSPTQFSLRNPLVVAGVAVALCLFGWFAYTSLGVAITPNVNVPQAIVTTTYPGADPATVEANVTRPIEDAIATLPNIDSNGLKGGSAFGDLARAMGMSVLLMYMLMMMLFGSLTLP